MFYVLFLLVALLGAPSVGAQPQERGFALSSFSWQAEVTSQPAITVVNEWGDLRVRTTDRAGLAVSAMIQTIGGTGDQFEIRVDETAAGVRVEVRPTVPGPRGRVDLTLMVPAGKRLKAVSRDGFSEVKYRGDVEVRTRRGAIFIETPARATARSEAGAITLKVTGDGGRQPQSAASRTGDVTVYLPDGAALTLVATTRSTVDVRVPHGEARTRRSGLVVPIGKGGAELNVGSVTGQVRVLPYGPNPARTKSTK